MRLEMEVDPWKFIGPCLLLAGWIIVVAAVAIFSSQGACAVFVIFGLLVELAGFVFFVRSRGRSAGERN